MAWWHRAEEPQVRSLGTYAADSLRAARLLFVPEHVIASGVIAAPASCANAIRGGNTMLTNSRPDAPRKLLRIRHLAEQGHSAIEIARSIGSTPGSVRVFCSRHMVKIRRVQRYIRSALPRHFHSALDHTIVARIPASLSSDFRRRAERLEIPVSVLASNLLAATAASDIYEAVLDDVVLAG